MYQVSSLSVDVGKTPDVLGSTGDMPSKNQSKGSAFSDAMEQHYPRKTAIEAENKKAQGGNPEPKAGDQPAIHDKNNEKTQFKRNDPNDAHTLPVPLPVDDESSVDNLTAADKPSISSISFAIDKEAMLGIFKAEKVKNDDAHTLPVPLPIDDESLETKPLIEGAYIAEPVKTKGEEHTLPVPLPVVPEEIKSTNASRIEGSSNSESAEATQYKTLLVNSSAQEPATAQSASKSLENDDAVDLLKMLNGAQQLLTKAATDNNNTKASEQKTAITDTAVAEQGKVTETKANTTLGTPANAQLPAGSELSERANNIKNLAANTEEPVTKTSDKVSVSNLVDTTLNNTSLKETKGNTDENNASIKAQLDLMNSANTDPKTSEKNVASDIELTSKQINTELKSALTLDIPAEKVAHLKDPKSDVDVKVNKTSVEQTKNVTDAQGVELKKEVTADLNRVTANDPNQARNINQNTATVVSASTADKSAAIDSAAKLANSADEEAASQNSTDEKKVNLADKAVSAFNPATNPAINPVIDAQAARATTSAAELAAHQEQSFESTISQLTTNTVQTQKSITAMNTETIAIYRKDFADAVKDKVMVMINQKIQQVEIQLDPPEMGNIHVRVNLQNEQAAVQFVVQNQQAKEALEQNMGKLRDMLAENGVDVGDANIEQRQASEQNNKGFEQTTSNGTTTESAEDNFSDNGPIAHDMVKASSTGVDYYA